MSGYLSAADQRHLASLFSLVDRDRSGSISKQEFSYLLRSLNLSASHSELDALIDSCDKNQNGEIDYDEFVQVMSRRQQTEHRRQELMDAFAAFEQTGGAGGPARLPVRRAGGRCWTCCRRCQWTQQAASTTSRSLTATAAAASQWLADPQLAERPHQLLLSHLPLLLLCCHCVPCCQYINAVLQDKSGQAARVAAVGEATGAVYSI
jgi:hypothetical protein